MASPKQLTSLGAESKAHTCISKRLGRKEGSIKIHLVKGPAVVFSRGASAHKQSSISLRINALIPNTKDTAGSAGV